MACRDCRELEASPHRIDQPEHLSSRYPYATAPSARRMRFECMHCQTAGLFDAERDKFEMTNVPSSGGLVTYLGRDWNCAKAQ